MLLHQKKTLYPPPFPYLILLPRGRERERELQSIAQAIDKIIFTVATKHRWINKQRNFAVINQ